MSTNTIFDYKQNNIETEQLGKVYVLQCGNLHNAVYAVKHPVKVLKNMCVNDSTPAYSKFFKSFDDAIKKYKKDFTNKLNDKDLNSIKRKHIQIVYDGTKGKDINPKCKTIIRRGRYWYAVYLQDNNVSRDLIVGGGDGMTRARSAAQRLAAEDTEEAKAAKAAKRIRLRRDPKLEDKELEDKELEDKELEDKELEATKLEDKELEEEVTRNIEEMTESTMKQLMNWYNPVRIQGNKLLKYFKDTILSNGENDPDTVNIKNQLEQMELDEETLQNELDSLCVHGDDNDNMITAKQIKEASIKQNKELFQSEAIKYVKNSQTNQPKSQTNQPIRKSARLINLFEKVREPQNHSTRKPKEREKQNHSTRKPKEREKKEREKKEREKMAFIAEEIIAEEMSKVAPEIHEGNNDAGTLNDVGGFMTSESRFENENINTGIRPDEKKEIIKTHENYEYFLKLIYIFDSVHDIFDRNIFRGDSNIFASNKKKINDFFKNPDKKPVNPELFIRAIFGEKYKDAIQDTFMHIQQKTAFNSFNGNEIALYHHDPEQLKVNLNHVIQSNTINDVDKTKYKELLKNLKKLGGKFAYIKETLYSYLLDGDMVMFSPLLQDTNLQGKPAIGGVEYRANIQKDILVNKFKEFNDKSSDKSKLCVAVDAIKGSLNLADPQIGRMMNGSQGNTQADFMILTPGMLIDPATTTVNQKYKFVLTNFEILRIPPDKCVRNEHFKITSKFIEIQLATHFEFEMYFFLPKKVKGEEEYKKVYDELNTWWISNKVSGSPIHFNIKHFDITSLEVFDGNVFLKVKSVWKYTKTAPPYLFDLILSSKPEKSYKKYLESAYSNKQGGFQSKESWAGYSVTECIAYIQTVMSVYVKLFEEDANGKMNVDKNIQHLWLYVLDWKRMGDSIQISYIKEYYEKFGKVDENERKDFPIIFFATQDILACCIALMKGIPVLFNTGSSTTYNVQIPVIFDSTRINNEYKHIITHAINDLFNDVDSEPEPYLDKVVEEYLKFKCSMYKSFSCLNEGIDSSYEEVVKTSDQKYRTQLYEDDIKYKYNMIELIKTDCKNITDTLNELSLNKDNLKYIDFNTIKETMMKKTGLNETVGNETVGNGKLESICDSSISQLCNNTNTDRMDIQNEPDDDIKKTELYEFFKNKIDATTYISPDAIMGT